MENCGVLITSMAFDILCYNGDAQVINKLTVMSYMLINHSQYNTYEIFFHKNKLQYNSNSSSIVNIIFDICTHCMFALYFSFAVGLSNI